MKPTSKVCLFFAVFASFCWAKSVVTYSLPTPVGESKRPETKSDTTARIVLREDTKLPRFGIYPYPWGKTAYVDTSTFPGKGLIFFFNPSEKLSLEKLKLLGELKTELEGEHRYQIFVVATFPPAQIPTPESLKVVMKKVETPFTVYRLSQPISFQAERPELPLLAWIQGQYLVGFFPGAELYNKMLFSLLMKAQEIYMKTWKPPLEEGGEKK